MIPRLQCCAEFPLTPNGKVNRQALSAGYLDTVIGTQIQLGFTNDPAALLAHIWRDVLAVPNITLDNNFFLLGASSLSVVTVSYRFRKAFGREIPVKTIYEHPTIRQLASVISNDRVSGVEHNNSALPSIVSTLLEDSKIADDIVPVFPVNSVDTTATDRPGVAFITGVTGFLGVYMLSELLQSPEVQVIFALVRANSASIAIKRVKHALQRYNLLDGAFPAFSKICVVPGCLEEDMFGLPDDLYQELVRNVQIIYHLGAKVNYTEPYSLHRPANVIGTRNVIQFAAASPLKPLHYISSIAAYGPVGLTQPGSYLSEEASLHLYLETMQFDIGYAQSQWVAEEMVRRAMDRGIPATVYRPGHILGGRPCYLGNTEDFVHRFVQACREIGACPHLPNQKKLFVPVDYTAITILKISLSSKAIGRCFNIVPPEREQSQHVDGFRLFEILRRDRLNMIMLSYPEWVERLERTDTPEENRLFALLPMLKTPSYRDGRTAWEVYANMPTYGTKNTEWALRGLSSDFPTLDDACYVKCFSHTTRSCY
ncbi:hypothetical protein ONZ45_g18696 [Pleurotus djamor]|nr:hypothetical protein ONZ45_g18696 [Pleurotus djamor]